MINQNNFFRGGRRPNKEPLFKINRFITADTVRITGDNIESKIVSLREALNISEELGLDLVEINGKSNPIVCKICDYSKFLYEKKKKDKEKKNANKHSLKEIKLGANIQEHDVAFKLKNSRKFLENGDKIKAYIQFRGREIVYKEQGELVLLKFIEALNDVGKPESLPKLEGKNMFVIITPK
jgi:translation initiation factor IF-3